MKGRREVIYITPLLPTHPSLISSISWNDIKALPEYISIAEPDKDTKPPTSLQPDPGDADDPWAWKETLDDISEEQPASPSVRSQRSVASWSSFGPFQLEDEGRAQLAVDDEGEEPQLETPSPANLADSGLNDCNSSGPPSPPISFSNKKRKHSSPRQESGSRAREEKTTRGPLRRPKKRKESQDSWKNEVAAGIEGLTPALTTTTRSSMRQSGSIATSGKNSIARDSWLSSLSSLSFSDTRVSPRILGWVNDNMIPEDLEEGEHSPEEKEDNASGDGTVEDSIDID